MLNKVKCRTLAKKAIILCATYFLSALVAQTKAQTTYDVFTYNEPKGYKKEVKTGITTYTKSDAKTGTYCIIGLYAQSPSSGDIIKDFENDWQDLVVKSFGVKDVPKADNSEDITGWKTYSGGANFEFSGGTSMALLTTAKNDNTNIAILIVTNAQSYVTTDVDAFFDKLKMGKPKAAVAKSNTVVNPIINKNAKTTSTNYTTMPVAYSFGEYNILISDNYFSSKKIINNIITYKVDVENFTINILQPYPSSGNLETDMDTYFYKVFDGFKKYNSALSNSDHTYKGTTAEGVPYLIECRDISKGEYPNEEKKVAMVMLFQLGNNIAIVQGYYDHMMEAMVWAKSESLKNVFLMFVHFLKFNSKSTITNPVAISGTKWSTVSTSGALLYDFKTNGTFVGAGAVSTKVSHNETHDKVTTTSYGNDGTWNLNGNNLTMNYAANKRVESSLLRIFYEKNYDNTWKEYLGLYNKGTNGMWTELKLTRNK
jgi:hypothetical protein